MGIVAVPARLASTIKELFFPAKAQSIPPVPALAQRELPAASAAAAKVQIDHATAVRAGIDLPVPLQQRFRTELRGKARFGKRAHAVAFEIAPFKRFQPFAGRCFALTAMLDPLLRRARTHDALAAVNVRLAQPRAAAGTGNFAVHVAAADRAVQP